MQNSTLSHFSTLTISFAPETEESGNADNLLVSADSTVIAAGRIKVTQFGRIYRFDLKAEDSDMRDKADMTVFWDVSHETVWFRDELGNVRNGLACVEKNGDVAFALAVDAQESGITAKSDFWSECTEWYGSLDSDEMVTMTYIYDNWDELV